MKRMDFLEFTSLIRVARNHRSREFHSLATETIRIDELRMKGSDKTRVGDAKRLHHRREFEKIHAFHERYLLAPSEKPLSPAVRGSSCTADFARDSIAACVRSRVH